MKRIDMRVEVSCDDELEAESFAPGSMLSGDRVNSMQQENPQSGHLCFRNSTADLGISLLSFNSRN